MPAPRTPMPFAIAVYFIGDAARCFRFDCRHDFRLDTDDFHHQNFFFAELFCYCLRSLFRGFHHHFH